ncbi:MAG: biopolymer transport protein ExbB [Rickettsiales bacterium]|jgi:biopolymer transport protein ExbB
MMNFQRFDQLGLMGFPLAFCSIAALAICLERLVFVIKNHRQKKKVFDSLSAYVLKYQNSPKQLRDEMVAIAINELTPTYYGNIKFLRIIATISPLIGLLGTILGIISAFKTIATQTSPISPNMIAGGLWEAMLTTAAGLMIALPCLVLAHLFRHFSEKQLGDFCLRLNKLSIAMEMKKGQDD